MLYGKDGWLKKEPARKTVKSYFSDAPGTRDYPTHELISTKIAGYFWGMSVAMDRNNENA